MMKNKFKVSSYRVAQLEEQSANNHKFDGSNPATNIHGREKMRKKFEHMPTCCCAVYGAIKLFLVWLFKSSHCRNQVKNDRK